MFSTTTSGVLGAGIKGINKLMSQRFLLLKVNAGALLAARCSSGCIFENLSFIAEGPSCGLTCRQNSNFVLSNFSSWYHLQSYEVFMDFTGHLTVISNRPYVHSKAADAPYAARVWQGPETGPARFSFDIDHIIIEYAELPSSSRWRAADFPPEHLG